MITRRMRWKHLPGHGRHGSSLVPVFLQNQADMVVGDRPQRRATIARETQ